MVKYFCEKCGKSFPHPSKLKRHNDRKTPCVSVGVKKTLQDPSKPFKSLQDPSRPFQDNLHTIKTQNHIKEDINGNYICEYCNKNIKYKKNYKNHLRNSCEEIPLSKRKLLLEKYNKKKNHTNKITTITNNDTPNNKNIINNNDTPNNKNIINNNTLNNNTTNNNNTLNINNNNYTININPLGKEDISKIGDENIIKYLCEGTKGFTKFLSSIYSINENRNIYIKNKKENIIQYINKDYQIDIGNLDEIISDLTLTHHNTFEDLFEIHQDKISKVNQNKYERANKSYNNNPERFERKTYLCLVNINNINKNYINNFLKIKNDKGEEQVIIGKL